MRKLLSTARWSVAMPVLPVILLATVACSSQPEAPPFDVAAYTDSIDQWREARAANLVTEDGWTTLVGLHWLREGENSVGSSADSVVQLPASAPEHVGNVTLAGSKAHFTPAPGIELPETDLTQDSEPDYTVLRLGTIRFYLIERGGAYGIRIKDSDSVARVNFHGLSWYPVDPDWVVQGSFIPDPHTIRYATEAGVNEVYPSPGFVAFERDGQSFRLETAEEDGELFYVIRDETSGETTYPAARFIYGPMPEELSEGAPVTIDFNMAYNPPCVFTDYATCPLPPPDNRLKLAVEAGEKTYIRNY